MLLHVEMQLGTVSAGPFAIDEARLTDMISRVIGGPRGVDAGALTLASWQSSRQLELSRSWHGSLAAIDEALRQARRGTARTCAARCAASALREAAWRPAFGRHNIWELVVHSAYWKYDIRRRLNGAKGRAFALEGSNFWARPVDGTMKEWKADLALLEAEHRALREAVEAFPPKRWTQKAPGKPFNFEGLVRGVAAHDLYHAGPDTVAEDACSRTNAPNC